VLEHAVEQIDPEDARAPAAVELCPVLRSEDVAKRAHLLAL
jgi:hypothetical protein